MVKRTDELYHTTRKIYSAVKAEIHNLSGTKSRPGRAFAESINEMAALAVKNAMVNI
jgi:hypothetical protein